MEGVTFTISIRCGRRGVCGVCTQFSGTLTASASQQHHGEQCLLPTWVEERVRVVVLQMIIEWDGGESALLSVPCVVVFGWSQRAIDR